MSENLKYSFNPVSFKFNPELTDSDEINLNKLIEISNNFRKLKDKKTLNSLVNHLFNYLKL